MSEPTCMEKAWDTDPLYSIKEITTELSFVVFFMCIAAGVIYLPIYLADIAGIKNILAKTGFVAIGYVVEAFTYGIARSMWKCNGE